MDITLDTCQNLQNILGQKYIAYFPLSWINGVWTEVELQIIIQKNAASEQQLSEKLSECSLANV